jgi:hypothetical protein
MKYDAVVKLQAKCVGLPNQEIQAISKVINYCYESA